MASGLAILDIRFGYGFGASGPSGDDPAARLSLLAGPDAMATRHPLPGFAEVMPLAREQRELARAARGEGAAALAAAETLKRVRREDAAHGNAMMVATFARAVDARDQLRERLTRFWADHFTARGRYPAIRHAHTRYIEDAIRPHVAGRFADMLRAAVLHPLMLTYLDQSSSVGPGSPVAEKNPKRGLNENLARELMELHTLGVDGHYTQSDVRQLAELLAGLSYDMDNGVRFVPRRGEPGPETVLGVSYGGDTPDLADIHRALDDLAAHPDTAQHIARKLGVHFVSDTPDADLVAHLAARFRQTDGDLLAVTAALLEHPAAQVPTLSKAKQPFDFIASALRALNMGGERLTRFDERAAKRWLRWPMFEMGQPWANPKGPDGWAEETAYWITPQGMAARITWALNTRRIDGMELPDPRDFVQAALGPLASERVTFAARAAETRAEGVAVVLASPEFQRR